MAARVGAQKFDMLEDFWRYGTHIHLSCSGGHCRYEAIVDAWQAWCWARLWRCPTALDADVMRHFVCSKCRARRPYPRPTFDAPTLISFFPADPKGWEMLRRRLRG